MVSRLPVLVGFGVKTPEMAAEVAAVADGVIVATSLIDRFEGLRSQGISPGAFLAEVGATIAEYRNAVDRGAAGRS